MKVSLLVVDPQNDFCVAQDGNNKGTLVVPGADQDMRRLAAMVRRLGPKLSNIHVTLDSHRARGIEREGWWKRASDGVSPPPFTCLGIHPDGKRVVRYAPGGSNPNAFGMSPTEEEYTTVIPSYMHRGGSTGKGSFGYLEALAARGRYPHIIWTPHCIIGSWGHNVVPELHGALCEWEHKVRGFVNYVTKGSNPWTEHFSGIAAEVPDPADPSTQINMPLIRALEESDLILTSGEALSHCVANTVRDVAASFADSKYVSKLVLLKDATSNVTGFDFLGDGFIQELQAKGMRIETTTTFAV